MEVYKAINAVQAAMAKTGLEKGRQNKTQGYSFRGIDDIYNSVTPLLVEHGLCILPRIISREATERQTKNGGIMIYAVVCAEFDFVAVADGSKYTVTTYGEAMDSGDKATNKAMSAAYKYAAIMTFGIPTEGDNDTENHTHELAAEPKPEPETDPRINDAAMHIMALHKGGESGALQLYLEQISSDKPFKNRVWRSLPTETQDFISSLKGKK